MDTYVKDYSDRRQENNRKKINGFAKVFVGIIVLLIVLIITVFPHKQYVENTSYGKRVVAINTVTKLAYYLDLEFNVKNIDGKTETWYRTVDKAVFKANVISISNEKFYSNEERLVLFHVSDYENNSEFKVTEIFFHVVFGGGKFKKQVK